ncbi:hypothetical protein E2C01_048778 [Portunus trituberculatus]|uniref:Uncharacterized protein n=1 Tax=Portunus trituberculatus TaxID=210409 RepID=A0A5B7GB25_PORTR|nr:hypothetical protein [Portunus trituberculatus]
MYHTWPGEACVLILPRCRVIEDLLHQRPGGDGVASAGADVDQGSKKKTPRAAPGNVTLVMSDTALNYEVLFSFTRLRVAVYLGDSAA